MTLEDIALSMTPGIGPKGAAHLLELFGDARRIFAATEAELIHQGELRTDLARLIVARAGFAAAERELKYCEKHGIRAIASTDSEYPILLEQIPDFPHILYIKGNVETLRSRCVAMVGTRGCTAYGLRMSNELISGLAERVPDLCIVSGLALGIDAACHRAALAAGVRTMAVLPCALPDVVPTQHANLAREILEQGGALITETSSQEKQRGAFYIPRNRIIAGVSAGTVIVESAFDGGSLRTADYADGYNRSLMAVPGRVGDRASVGTNMLIRNEKAHLVTSAEDIVRELQWDLDLPVKNHHKYTPAIEFTKAEAAVMACFPTTDSVTSAQVSEQCGFDAAQLSALLVQLEIAGALRRLPGNIYIKERCE